MTVVIRMKRTGRRNRPCYRISVADQRAPRDGSTLENLGLYDPIAARPEARLTLDVERAKHWISVGAQPSETVRSIFKRQGVYAGAAAKEKRDRSGRKRTTKTGERRAAAQRARSERKAERRKNRPKAKPKADAKAKAKA
jgi:small subunit ribosomal protein S16